MINDIFGSVSTQRMCVCLCLTGVREVRHAFSLDEEESEAVLMLKV